MFDVLKKKWLAALKDPARVIEYALLLTQTKSPWGWYETLQPSIINLATNGAETTILGPDVTGATYRKLDPASQDVLILEQLDFWYQETGAGSLTTDINASTLKFLIANKLDRRLPEFALNYYSRGDSVLRFGKIPLGWVVPRNQDVSVNVKPSASGTDNFDVYLDLLVRHEPLWLMEAAGLIDVKN